SRGLKSLVSLVQVQVAPPESISSLGEVFYYHHFAPYITPPVMTAACMIKNSPWYTRIRRSLCTIAYQIHTAVNTWYPTHELSEIPAAVWSLKMIIACGIVITGSITAAAYVSLSTMRGFVWFLATNVLRFF